MKNISLPQETEGEPAPLIFFVVLQVSKATMLSKAAEYISKLQAERQAQAEEAARLRQQAAAFNLEIRYLYLAL